MTPVETIPKFSQEEIYQLFISIAVYPTIFKQWDNKCVFMDSFVVSFLNKEGLDIYVNDIDTVLRIDLHKYIFSQHMLTTEELFKKHLSKTAYYQNKEMEESVLGVLYGYPLADMPLYLDDDPPKNIISQWRLTIGK